MDDGLPTLDSLWAEEQGADPMWDLALADFAGGQQAIAAPERRMRCLDRTHEAACPLCAAAPEDASSVELVGEQGKKNGEKRLRSLVARMPEWASAPRRSEAAEAAALEPGRGKLAAALRSKHCSELRKADLLFLCRLWGYQSDVWMSRKQRRVGGRDATAPPAPASQALQQPLWLAAAAAAAQPPLLPALAFPSVLAAAQGGQVDAVRSLCVSETRVLAQQSAESFSDVAVTRQLLDLLRTSSPHVQPSLLEVVRRKLSNVRYAQRSTERIGSELRELHAALQAQLMGLSQADGAALAWQAFAGREPPLDPLCRQLQELCALAISPAPPVALPGAEEEAEPSWFAAGDLNLRAGGTRALQVLTVSASILSQLKLARLHIFLEATSALTDVLIGQTAAIAAGLERHETLLAEEERRRAAVAVACA